MYSNIVECVHLWHGAEAVILSVDMQISHCIFHNRMRKADLRPGSDGVDETFDVLRSETIAIAITRAMV
jgi:hypothetical protein